MYRLFHRAAHCNSVCYLELYWAIHPYLKNFPPVTLIIIWTGDGFVQPTLDSTLRGSDALNVLIILIKQFNIQADIESVSEELSTSSSELPSLDT